ncbi:hypothetical protein FIU86_04810 [Roseovarius sp. THAF9]|uniref:hypothetical protein n=1 Tax=Roseovarius sp. THAF9 TaxID=2587847 RepID=UPI001267F9EE|nr:hypothetical protein [Roseovarius sp. THAF9]QFT92152.1 hypothetical protein FIU86_04810 [Roseovarius sp. THAF9]
MPAVFNDSSTVMSEAGWGGSTYDGDDFRHIKDKEERAAAKRKAAARSAKIRRWQAVRSETFTDEDYAEEEARIRAEIEEWARNRAA